MEVNVDRSALAALDVKLAVLFGSRARGSARPTSDWDVAVMFGRKPDVAAISGVLGAVRVTEGEVGIATLDEADALLLHEVAVDGRPLYEDEPGRWEEFRILAFKRYYDTAWMRRVEAETLRRRFG